MPRLPQQDIEKFRAAVQSHDFLHRIVRQAEKLHHLVFHRHDLHTAHIRASAEEILIADIVLRHRGNFDGIYFALRAAEDSGKTWEQAIADYAASIHSYYTTPLGILIRRDLFGPDAHFVSPLADHYAATAGGGNA